MSAIGGEVVVRDKVGEEGDDWRTMHDSAATALAAVARGMAHPMFLARTGAARYTERACGRTMTAGITTGASAATSEGTGVGAGTSAGTGVDAGTGVGTSTGAATGAGAGASAGTGVSAGTSAGTGVDAGTGVVTSAGAAAGVCARTVDVILRMTVSVCAGGGVSSFVAGSTKY